MKQITFDKSSKKEILEFLNKEVDSEGFIIEKDNVSQRVLTFDGEEISIEEFGGMQKGSEVFIKNDIIALLRLCKKK